MVYGLSRRQFKPYLLKKAGLPRALRALAITTYFNADTDDFAKKLALLPRVEFQQTFIIL